MIHRVWADDDTDNGNDFVEANFDDNNEGDNLLSASYTTITNESPNLLAAGLIKAFGLVIDNDNSFSTEDVKEYGYRINSVN